MNIIDTRDTTGDGNTCIPRIRARKWVFTWNNPELKHADVSAILHDTKKYVFQKEEGENKTPHYQGYVEYKNARSFSSMKKLIPNAHWEKCNNSEASIAYCQKLEGRLAGPWTKGFPKKIKLLDQANFYDWQLDVIDQINREPNDRTIHWYWSEAGNNGKTQLCKYICSKYNALLVDGSPKDAKYIIANHIDKDPINADDLIILFNFSRSRFINSSDYQVMESIKDGIFVSTKYESRPIIINSPHMFIFANQAPDLGALTEDRWNLVPL